VNELSGLSIALQPAIKLPRSYLARNDAMRNKDKHPPFVTLTKEGSIKTDAETSSALRSA
tara:strand:- start:372 stop:551 length:180 start_codon:yes stop_codon:yes gene_type:complete